MQTRYLTSLTTHFNPLSTSPAHRIPRLLLSRLPSSALAANGAPLPVTTKILPRSTREPARLVIGFKGGETLEFVELTKRRAGRQAAGEGEKTAAPAAAREGVMDLGKLGIKDVLEEVSRRCRILGRKDQIAG